MINISFVRTADLKRAASITFDNMRVYYQQFAPEWDVSKVFEATLELENYDILFQQQVVGVMRLQFNDDCCVLRDLQIIDSAKNKGIGRASVNEAKRRALNAKLTTLTLRVFKISPAVALYKEMALLYKVKMNAFSIW